jgi:hypothetical protein
MVSTSAIFVAHPGHELRVYHWMEQQRPLYCCLTEGSGGTAESRMDSTTRLLESIGGAPGPVYGRYPDKTVYAWLVEGRTDVFVQLATELADALIAHGSERVAGDAMEGFNPVHDVWRLMVDGAVAMVRARTGRTIRNEDFVLDSDPSECPDEIRAAATWLHLDDAALTRKIDAAMAYTELRDEVSAALARFGRDAFALECLRPVTSAQMLDRFEHQAPPYELYGQVRVSQGRYQDVIRYHAHVRPVWQALQRAVAAAGDATSAIGRA